MVKKYSLMFAFLLCAMMMNAQQKFFNLTAEEVKVDSILSVFTHSFPLGENYADSVYTVSILYPEFIDMSDAEVKKFQLFHNDSLSALPKVKSAVVTERKRGSLEVYFAPFVVRDGKYQKLVSFMLKVEGKVNAQYAKKSKARRRAGAADRYAAHSVLASGKWAKIRVPETGVYQLTEELIRKAGFTDLSKVHVYGYGGNLQSESLYGYFLEETDDLKEVTICENNGKRLFHGKGPVSWSSNSSTERIRNPYSDYGCYFITQTDKTTETVDSATFVKGFYPSYDDYHTLHEVDNFAWYEGGRNLYEDDPIYNGESKTYTLKMPKASSGGLSVILTAAVTSTANVTIKDQSGNTMTQLTSRINLTDSYDHGQSNEQRYTFWNSPGDEIKVEVQTTSGGPIRLDYISVYSNTVADAPRLSAVTAVPEYVYNITNQDRHADGQVNMVIIIPTSQRLREQAERLKAFHEIRDGLSVRIVPADELFNEFSSGTPDANAYRRYMKMLYDRAGNDVSQMPKYLVLFGDAAWDNRMNCSAWANFSPDDFLLCFESENSFSATKSYVNDSFFTYLDDGEGGNPTGTDKMDVAVGRFPVRTAAEAKIMVDKTISYVENANAGSWQNMVVMMGDDGNDNLHMTDADGNASLVESLKPGMVVKRVMWDAYTLESTSTGNTYPEVSALIKQYQNSGALVMNYSGHGAQTQISHESVLRLNDFKNFTNKNLPLWITASCEISPFDSQTENIGEQAVLNANGGAVAFYGTTRTVYTDRNRRINRAYLRELFSIDEETGKYTSLGEAQRRAKNSLIEGGIEGFDNTENKLQYALLGDPALVLNIPTYDVVIDEINGKPLGDANDIQLKAFSKATVKGHVELNGEKVQGFNGIMSATVRDSEELIVCKMNKTADARSPFTFKDRTKTLFQGTDNVKNGEFSFTFAVPKDINYSNESGLVNIYALDTSTKVMANGSSSAFIVGGTEDVQNDEIGPDVYCYLNSPSFTNGGNVNTTPYFVAQISDEDGINTTGTGIGHDLELIIDGEAAKTYLLNDYFAYDFGSFTKGEVRFSIPALPEGPHTLKFRAWDVKNNSTTRELKFNVVEGLQPNFFDVNVSKNPARDNTTFIISHDRVGSNLNVEIDIFDIGGRQIWNYTEQGVATGNTYTVDWNLTVDSGKLQTGVYLYRVKISSDNSSQVTRAKKLIVVQ